MAFLNINLFITIFVVSTWASKFSFYRLQILYKPSYLRSKINPSAGALYALGSCPGPSPLGGGGELWTRLYMCQMTGNDTEIPLPMINVQVAIKYFSFFDQLQTYCVSGFSKGALFPVNIIASCYSFSRTPTCWHCLNLHILDTSIGARDASIIIKYQL